MSAVTVTLIIIVPDDIDPDTRAEIAEAAEPHDTDGGLERWLGDKLCAVEDELGSRLPDGWHVGIYEVEAT